MNIGNGKGIKRRTVLFAAALLSLFFFTRSFLLTAVQAGENQYIKDDIDFPAKEKDIEYLYDKNHLLGKIVSAKDTLFAKADYKYIGYRKSVYLLKPVFEAYVKMYDAAAKEGIKLNLISGFRSFYHQKAIWESKWTGRRLVEGKNLSKTNDTLLRAKMILKYSAMPGTSRHHWGTDIDIFSLENSDFEKPYGRKIYNWLIDNASKFGFCQVYTRKDSLRPYGYEEEKWHWSFFPISEKLLKEYQRQIKYSDISGFKGSGTARPLKVIENYVVGINNDCK